MCMCGGGQVWISVSFSVRLFNFSYHVMVEKVLFLDQIFKKEILMDLHVMRTIGVARIISWGGHRLGHLLAPYYLNFSD